MARPFKPDFTAQCRFLKPMSGADPGGVLAADVPCAWWFSGGRTHYRQSMEEWPIFAQLAVDRDHFYGAYGWSGKPPVYDTFNALRVQAYDALGDIGTGHPVFGGIMWHGTWAVHIRYELTLVTAKGLEAGSTVVLYDQLDSANQGRETTCDIYRPFGSSSLVEGSVPCYVYPGTRGQVASNFAFNFPDFDTVLIVHDDVDIRDGNGRTVNVDGAQYHDGDEIHIPSGSGNTRFVVVRVERTTIADGSSAKRVFALRDTAVWPGP